MASINNTSSATSRLSYTDTINGPSSARTIEQLDHQEAAANTYCESSSDSEEETVTRVRLATPPRLRNRAAPPASLETRLKYLEARRQRKVAATSKAAKSADVAVQFRQFRDLPPELVLQVMKQASKSPGMRDMKALVLSSKTTHGLWKSCKKGIFKYVLKKYAEFEGYFGEMEGFLESGSEKGAKMVTDMGSAWVKKTAGRTEDQTHWIWNAARKEHDLKTGLEGPGFKWGITRRVEMISNGGAPFVDMLERLSKVVDADFVAFQKVPGSGEVEEELARKALLLLWTTRWRHLVMKSKEEMTWQDPCWEDLTQEALVRDQPVEVRLALRQILKIVLERARNQLGLTDKGLDMAQEYTKKVERGGYNTYEAHDPMSATEMKTWVERQAFATLLHFTGERGIQDMIRAATSNTDLRKEEWVRRLTRLYTDAVWSRVAALESDEVEVIESNEEWNFWMTLQEDDDENVWWSVDPRVRWTGKV